MFKFLSFEKQKETIFYAIALKTPDHFSTKMTNEETIHVMFTILKTFPFKYSSQRTTGNLSPRS